VELGFGHVKDRREGRDLPRELGGSSQGLCRAAPLLGEALRRLALVRELEPPLVAGLDGDVVWCSRAAGQVRDGELEMASQSNMRRGFLLSFALLEAACAARRGPVPAAMNLSRKPTLAPHFEEVAYGLYACERGYVLMNGRCLTDAEVPHGPMVEVSDLPSAGDGARGTCPSGGCYQARARNMPYYYPDAVGYMWFRGVPLRHGSRGRGPRQLDRRHHRWTAASWPMARHEMRRLHLQRAIPPELGEARISSTRLR
jgi:hypothetical protein